MFVFIHNQRSGVSGLFSLEEWTACCVLAGCLGISHHINGIYIYLYRNVYIPACRLVHTSYWASARPTALDSRHPSDSNDTNEGEIIIIPNTYRRKHVALIQFVLYWFPDDLIIKHGTGTQSYFWDWCDGSSTLSGRLWGRRIKGELLFNTSWKFIKE